MAGEAMWPDTLSELPRERVEAGAEYLAAIRSLGLDPEGLMWITMRENPGWILVLITALYDEAGPLGLTRLLFAAYNASILPKTVDPFSVDVYSPEQEMAKVLFGNTSGEHLSDFGHFGSRRHPQAERLRIQVGDIVIPTNGIYVWEPKRRVWASERTRQWEFFKENIEHRLAA